MFTMRLRALTAGSAAALLLLPLSGCGSDTGDGVAADAARTSSGTSTDGGPALDKDDFAEAMAKAIAEKESAHVTMDMGAAFSMSGDVDYGGDSPEMKMTMDLGTQQAAMVLADGAFFLQLPGLTPAGKWTRIDQDDPRLGALAKQMDGFGPEGTVKVMEQGIRDIELVGHERIDGESTDHYKVTIDTAAARDAMGALGQQAGQADLPQEMTYDLYLDDEDLMRRVTIDLGSQKLVVNATDWGKDVDIDAPETADVVELPSGSGS
ncbi:MAG TPA: LppX_LprAFG lipoprotein [Marmoricola sp.]|jgi:hypothetical protein|nr:LppX_LprAFG lipoprotein [Marmoricola sp.]